MVSVGRRARYHPGGMRQTGTAFLLAILVAALPTIVSLCELRCVAAEIAPVSTPPACAGHEAEKGSEPSPGGHHDCGGHVLLAKGGSTGAALQLDLSVVLLGSSPSFVFSADQRPEHSMLESADLSPPFSRSSDLLRL